MVSQYLFLTLALGFFYCYIRICDRRLEKIENINNFFAIFLWMIGWTYIFETYIVFSMGNLNMWSKQTMFELKMALEWSRVNWHGVVVVYQWSASLLSMSSVPVVLVLSIPPSHQQQPRECVRKWHRQHTTITSNQFRPGTNFNVCSRNTI